MDRAWAREYIGAKVTGALEWPALDSMPASDLPYENRGLVTAGPAPSALQLPYSNDLSSGAGGEPAMLDPQDGSFELAPAPRPTAARPAPSRPP